MTRQHALPLSELERRIRVAIGALRAHVDGCYPCGMNTIRPTVPIEMYPKALRRRVARFRKAQRRLRRCATGLPLFRSWRIAVDRYNAASRL